MISSQTIRLILVQPEQPRNIGSVIRIAANLGLSAVSLVRDSELTPEDHRDMTIASSGASSYVTVHNFDSLSGALQGCDFVIGTSGRKRSSGHVTGSSLKELLPGRPGSIALVFGRESQGLSTSELACCDALLSLPVSENFPSINLSHAVTIVLWEAIRILNSVPLDIRSSYRQQASRDLQERWLTQLNLEDSRLVQLRNLLRRSEPSDDDMALLFNLTKSCSKSD